MGSSADLASRIGQYRELAGISQVELASEIGIDRTAMSKIESGTRRVSAVELHDLARVLGIRMEWLFSDPPSSIVAYRRSSADQVLAGIDVAIERLSREVEFVRDHAAIQWPEFQPSMTDPATIDPELFARRLRATSGFGVDPIRSMTKLAERLGVALFSLSMGTDAPDGGSTPLAHAGIAVVNGDRDTGRRRLAAAHELGHLICGDHYEVDWRLDRPEQGLWEAKLDQFARALLLPAEPLEQVWRHRGGGDFDERAQALTDASNWQVDMSTLARRLRHLDLVDEAAANRIRHYKHRRADFDELDLVVRTDLEPPTLPRIFTRSVLDLYRREFISADRALDLLQGAYSEAELPEPAPLPEGSIWALL